MEYRILRRMIIVTVKINKVNNKHKMWLYGEKQCTVVLTIIAALILPCHGSMNTRNTIICI